MKNFFKKISDVFKMIFGYGIMITLFIGGLTFLGYIIALMIGGSIAINICDIIYNIILPITIYSSTVLVLLGLVAMYLAGEFALTASTKKNSKHDTER